MFENAIKNQIVRQDSRHRRPEDGNNAKHVYLKLSQLSYGHVIRMHEEQLPEKVSMENYRRERTLKVAKTSFKTLRHTKTSLKTLRHTNTASGTG